MKSIVFPSVKILEESRISPAPLSGAESRPSLPFTFFDIFWMDYNPVERLFFYHFPHPTSLFLESHLPALKSSLCVALAAFYPLAATASRRVSDGRFEIAPSDSDSVPLTVAEYEGADFLFISGDRPRPIEQLVPLVSPLPPSSPSMETQPLLALQITLFPNAGLCLAVTVHHAACDGLSSIQFIKLWAATTAAADLSPPPPAIHRPCIPDPRNLYAQMEEALFRNRRQATARSDASVGLLASTFRLSPAEVDRLKDRFHCSSFVASCAYSWVCLTKAQRVVGPTHFLFAVDWRRRGRVRRVPEDYFGNCLSGCFVTADADELASERGGVSTACRAIGKSIENLGDDVDAVMDGLVGRLEELKPWRPLSTAGSPKLGVYEVNFGWGRPSKVEVISTRETGGMALAEGREGLGGIEIGFILPKEELSAFASYFASAISAE